MLFELTVIFICLALGGMLKGAIGAGTPLLAVPALAAVFDVPFAIVILVVPNLVTNIWQVWQYRSHAPDAVFTWQLVIGGGVGIAVGTWLLTTLTSDTLLASLGVIVLAYIALRLVRPHFRLPFGMATILSFPAGFGSGALQGATGLSAPISMTFLNAMRLERETFIFTVSSLFTVFVLVQIPALAIAGILNQQNLLLSTLAVIPVLIAMPLGSYLVKRLPPGTFDKLILFLLAVISVKLLFDAFA